MKSKNKRIIITAIALLLSCMFFNFGEGRGEVRAEENTDNAQTFVIGPCPVHGVHKMYLQTAGGITIRNKGTRERVLFNPLYYKCSCGEDMFTSGQPHNSHWDVGHYLSSGTFWYEKEGLGGLYYEYYTNHTSSTIPYAKTLEGYKFYN